MVADQSQSGKRSDEQLMAAVQGGDDDAMGALFDRHHRAVHALCVRLTRDPDLADDVAQDVFLRVWRYARSFRARSSFRTWLYRLAYNACVDASQRDARWKEVDPLESRESSAQELPVDAVADRQVILEEALSRLPPAHREVLVLSRFHDLGYEEIGRIINCSPGTARVRLHRAMNELRQLCFALDGGARELR
jgi:RNA polymerase sigma factor (sigma-70 family)